MKGFSKSGMPVVEEWLDVIIVGLGHPGILESMLLTFCVTSQGTILVICIRVGLSCKNVD